ncbi:hypothetical protein [Larkinella sp. C7]|uniref:hypothetical protein n=1 Tax=Larkinella sp. C7 TaxID=2576607 RepID=UPI0011110D89|nr:hypothetical protein [Larkinella sp. C7]
MASKRFDEFLQNASPELKSKIAEAGEKALTRNGIKNDQPINQEPRPLERRAEQARPEAAEPKPLDTPTGELQFGQRRIDQAIAESQQSKTPEPSQEKTQSNEQER